MTSKQFGRYGILFVISAPSGAGKTTLVEAFRQTPEFVYSVSCTTRPARTGEIEGEDYHFLSESDFLARVQADEFLEYAEVHGHYYGTLRNPVLNNLKNGVDVLIDIDTQGAAAELARMATELQRRAPPPFVTAMTNLSARPWPMFLLCRQIWRSYNGD